MNFLYLICYACLRLRFLDVETNPGQPRPVSSVCRILCSTVWGLAGNLSELTMASSQYDILLRSETLVSDMHNMSELLVPGFGRPGLLCRARSHEARGMAAYIRVGYGTFRQPKFECGCCKMLVFIVCGVRQNLPVLSIYCNPDLDNWIFDCLLASMAAVQAEDIRASFLFVGNLNGHRQEWLGSTTTNRHGVAAFDFVTVSGCDQLVVDQTNACGLTLLLLLLFKKVSSARLGESDIHPISPKTPAPQYQPIDRNKR